VTGVYYLGLVGVEADLAEGLFLLLWATTPIVRLVASLLTASVDGESDRRHG